MHKKLIYMTLASAMLLAACDTTNTSTDDAVQDTTEDTQADAEETTDETTNETADSETDTNDDESNDTDSTDTTDEEDDETVTAEDQEIVYEVNPANFTITPIEGTDANEQVALLTYDDAPDTYAVEIAKILQEKDAPAIFFVNGMYIEDEEGQEMLKEIHEMGFEIGNHTHTHPSLPSISEEQQTEEILKTSDLIEEIIGVRPRFFRAPFGQNTDHTRQVALDDGMTLMNWTYGYDWEADYMDGDALADIMVNTNLLANGANLLMHDREWTMQATPDIIDGLRDKGFELVDPALIRSEFSESEDDIDDNDA